MIPSARALTHEGRSWIFQQDDAHCLASRASIQDYCCFFFLLTINWTTNKQTNKNLTWVIKLKADSLQPEIRLIHPRNLLVVSRHLLKSLVLELNDHSASFTNKMDVKRKTKEWKGWRFFRLKNMLLSWPWLDLTCTEEVFKSRMHH